MRLVLIRHGETYSNTLYGTEQQVLIGALDSEITYLNENGMEQAKRAREILRHLNIVPDRIFVSDLYRTRQTANIIFPETHYITDSRLRERSLGALEGMKLLDVLNDEILNQCLPDSSSDYLDVFLSKKHESGESFLDVYKRCSNFMKQFDYNSDETIIIVSHFHTIRCLIYVLLDKMLDESFSSLSIANATPYVFDFVNGCFHCNSIKLNGIC